MGRGPADCEQPLRLPKLKKVNNTHFCVSHLGFCFVVVGFVCFFALFFFRGNDV